MSFSESEHHIVETMGQSHLQGTLIEGRFLRVLMNLTYFFASYPSKGPVYHYPLRAEPAMRYRVTLRRRRSE